MVDRSRKGQRIYYMVCTVDYMIFGANESTFFCPASKAIAPIILDPAGSFLLFNKMQALSSNRTTVPSGRVTPFLVLTTRALRTSPLRTFVAAAAPTAVPVAIGLAFWTTTVISSPIPANRPARITLTHYGQQDLRLGNYIPLRLMRLSCQ